MTSSVLERPEVLETAIEEVNKEELCRKLCINIFEGLLEGYESLKQKNPAETASIDSKIEQLKDEMNRQKALA
jgi:hypothetical protein